MKLTHDLIERNQGLMIALVIAVIAVGGLVEIVPLSFQKSVTEPVAGLKPYGALELTGRDIYVREGCYNCHSQMVRPFRAEVERYGPYSHRPGPAPRRRALLRRLAPHPPDQPARRGARVQHARVPVAREDARECAGHRGQAEGAEAPRRALHG
jgi:hypothetical protein